MITRRDYLGYSVLTGILSTLQPGLLRAIEGGNLITRAIPSSGEELPIVGLGGSATFSYVARSDDVSALRDVLRVLFEHGGSVFDTAPAYGASEKVAGRIVQELGATERVFWATKLNVAGRR
ncbi:MAG: aldo/keto reductase, partial [Woeseia sp.]